MSAFFFLSDIYKENSSTMDETKVDIDLINGTPVCKICCIITDKLLTCKHPMKCIL